MTEAPQFLLEYSGPVLFGVVLLEQAGLPLPALPWLLAAGALAARGRADLIMSIGVTVLACLVADSAWFYIGRRKGKRVLGPLCRMSLEPGCCVQRGQGFLARHAEKGLVASKFLPWLGMVMAPLAATVGISYRRFLIFDGIGSLLYASCGILLGFAFSEQLHQALALAGKLGVGAFALVLTLLSIYGLFKIIKWRRSVGPTIKRDETDEAAADQAAAFEGRSARLSPAGSTILSDRTAESGVVEMPNLNPEFVSAQSVTS